MDGLVTVIFWIATLVVAGGLALAYGRGWRAVAEALTALERRRADEGASEEATPAQDEEAAAEPRASTAVSVELA